MRFEGRVWKARKGRFWLIEVPLLNVMSQGTTMTDAYEMIADAIETLIGEEDLSIEVIPGRRGTFMIEPSRLKPMIALMLRRQRMKQGLTVREVAARMNARSPSAYARYEQGLAMPTIETLDRILAAIEPESRAVLKTA